MNIATKQFITDNQHNDIHQLALQSSKNPDVDVLLAIRQIAGKQKIKAKVPSFYQCDNLLYPVQLSLEQSSSEVTAQYKSSLCEGETLVDLTGGFGVDCHFMSSRFKKAVYVERDNELCSLATHNFNALGRNHIRVINEQTEKYLIEMPQVDWIFIDPARRSLAGKKVVLLSDCEPDVSVLSSNLLQKAKNVMIKLSPMMDIAAAIRDLPHTVEVHILAVENECKEVLLILGKEKTTDLQLKTINFGKNDQNQQFNFNSKQEQNAASTFTSTPNNYLYEPNAAIMKAGAFKSIGVNFDIYKLHINTHLYTSNQFISNFPGRIFEIKKIWENSKAELKKMVLQHPKANISVRNYPLSTDELRKKLKIKDGGDTYLFACTLANNKKVIIETKKAIDA